jgi:parvulin-like peptidyl-prolyl isomerase
MTDSSRLPRWLLILGLVAGIVVAAGDLVLHSEALPEGAVARVNQKLVSRDAWLRAVAAVASERRTPLTDADQQLILDRLIDEELLVQHGLSLGLIEQDRRLRGQLVQDVLATAQVQAEGGADEEALRRFYDEHRDFFTKPARLRVAALRMMPAAIATSAPPPPAGGGWGEGSPFQPQVPDALLPVSELRTYLGPALTEAALKLEVGATSEPLPGPSGSVVLHVIAREDQALPAFDDIRDRVAAEYRRRQDEAEVRRLLKQLRKDANVVVRP